MNSLYVKLLKNRPQWLHSCSWLTHKLKTLMNSTDKILRKSERQKTCDSFYYKLLKICCNINIKQARSRIIIKILYSRTVKTLRTFVEMRREYLSDQKTSTLYMVQPVSMEPKTAEWFFLLKLQLTLNTRLSKSEILFESWVERNMVK